MPRNSIPSWRRLAPIVCALAVGLALASCDKCGNSIFGSNAGPLVCKEKLPG
jgi:hypothetical protein